MHFIAEHQEKMAIKDGVITFELTFIPLLFICIIFTLCTVWVVFAKKVWWWRKTAVFVTESLNLCTVPSVLSWGTSEPSHTDPRLAKYSFHQWCLKDREPRIGSHKLCICLHSPTLFLKLYRFFGAQWSSLCCLILVSRTRVKEASLHFTNGRILHLSLLKKGGAFASFWVICQVPLFMTFWIYVKASLIWTLFH